MEVVPVTPARAQVARGHVRHAGAPDTNAKAGPRGPALRWGAVERRSDLLVLALDRLALVLGRGLGPGTIGARGAIGPVAAIG